MCEFPLHAPTDDEISDAVEGLEHVLRLEEIGELDLPPYLTRMLLQLEETLEAAAGAPTEARAQRPTAAAAAT